MQTQCLVIGEKPTVEVEVRFLHVVERKVAKLRGAGTACRGGFSNPPVPGSRRRAGGERLEFVDELRVGMERYLAWEEAAEREVVASGLGLADLETPMRTAISVPAGTEESSLADEDGQTVGALVRSWNSLEGTVGVEAEPCAKACSNSR